jgi:uncharacterized membrane protein YfcA
MSETSEMTRRRGPLAFVTAAVIGTLGGLIGLGGAEFRLPLLITLFRFRGLEAVILNKAVSLLVVATALPFRTADVSFAAIGEQWPIIVNLLAGSLAVAWGWSGMGHAPEVRNALSHHRAAAGLNRSHPPVRS